jgi:hypothetical protein
MQQRDITSSSVVMAPARITCVMQLDLFRVYKVIALLVTCICTSNFTTAQTTNTFTNVTSVPVGLTLTVADRASSLPAVPLETNNFMFSLEGGPCRLTIRHLYSSITSWLLWNANYFVKPLPPAPGRKCTLKFTTAGDLQLLAGNTLIWHSGTAGKGVTTMSLATVGDYGNFRLLDAKNRTVWQSFDYPEFAIIPTQKFRFAHFLWHRSQTFRHDQSPYASCLFPGVGSLYCNDFKRHTSIVVCDAVLSFD